MPGAGKPAQNARTSAAMRSSAASSSTASTTRPNQSAIRAISGAFMPRLVTAAVPRRRPLGLSGGAVSPGKDVLMEEAVAFTEEMLRACRPLGPARVVLNERTGTIVMGKDVRLSTVAVSHGNLSLIIRESADVTQPNPLAEGETVVVPQTEMSVVEDEGQLVVLDMIMEEGFDGLDTYREVLKRHPGQRAVIVSGFSSTERVQEMLRLGAAAARI